jgi:deuterolysin
MFFRPLVALSLFGIALATPLKRADNLVVSVSGPSESVSSVDDLKFTATVTNNGAETVKILKYGTILDDKLPTRSFTVTKDGESVDFTGIKVSCLVY